MQVERCNLLPDEYVQRYEYVRLSKLCIRILTKLSLVLLLGTSIIAGACIFLQSNRDIDVPDDVKKAYISAQTNSLELKKKKELLEKAKAEDCQAIKNLSILLSYKPNEVKLTKCDISNAVAIEGYSSDPAIINQYVSQLNNAQVFNKATIDKISALAGDIKSFTIKAEKK